MVEVTQSARDAAADYGELTLTKEGMSSERAKMIFTPIRLGLADKDPLVQAFAASEQRGHIAGMREASGIAITHFPGSAGYEPYMAAGHAISKAIDQRAQAIRQEPVT